MGPPASSDAPHIAHSCASLESRSCRAHAQQTCLVHNGAQTGSQCARLRTAPHPQLPSVARCATELKAILKVLGNRSAPDRQKKEVHLLLMLIVVGPSVHRLHIGWNDDAAAAPQPQPGNLKQSLLQQGILTKGGNSSDSLVVGMTKRECLISSACIQHVYAANSWPSLASLSTCCLNSRNAAAWRMLASMAAGMSIPGSLRSIRGHPSRHTRSPLTPS